MNRLELVAETMRASLNAISVEDPTWLQAFVPSNWYKRYARRIEEDRLPQGKEKRALYAESVGRDGFFLLYMLEGVDHLANLPTIQAMRSVWQRHYDRSDEGVRFKSNKELTKASAEVESPYETEARFRKRYATSWVGYNVHLTETCDDDSVHLVTHVETTDATVHESQKTGEIHQALVQKELPPSQHFVDAAYVDAKLLVDSRQDGISLIGPAMKNNYLADADTRGI